MKYEYLYYEYFRQKMAYPNKVAEFSADAAAVHLLRSAYGKIHVHTASANN